MTRIAVCVPVALALFVVSPSPASQKPCRDAQGKVIKCPKPRAASPRCKDAGGRFVPCPEGKGKAKGG